jgi:hypothetical protein
MDNALIVHVFQGRNDLFAVVCSFLLRKLDFWSEIFEQTLWTVLENQINIFVVIEKTI